MLTEDPQCLSDLGRSLDWDLQPNDFVTVLGSSSTKYSFGQTTNINFSCGNNSVSGEQRDERSWLILNFTVEINRVYIVLDNRLFCIYHRLKEGKMGRYKRIKWLEKRRCLRNSDHLFWKQSPFPLPSIVVFLSINSCSLYCSSHCVYIPEGVQELTPVTFQHCKMIWNGLYCTKKGDCTVWHLVYHKRKMYFYNASEEAKFFGFY